MARFLLVGFIMTVSSTIVIPALDVLEDRIASRRILRLDMAVHMGVMGNVLHALPEFAKLQVVKAFNAAVYREMFVAEECVWKVAKELQQLVAKVLVLPAGFANQIKIVACK